MSTPRSASGWNPLLVRTNFSCWKLHWVFPNTTVLAVRSCPCSSSSPPALPSTVHALQMQRSTVWASSGCVWPAGGGPEPLPLGSPDPSRRCPSGSHNKQKVICLEVGPWITMQQHCPAHSFKMVLLQMEYATPFSRLGKCWVSPHPTLPHSQSSGPVVYKCSKKCVSFLPYIFPWSAYSFSAFKAWSKSPGVGGGMGHVSPEFSSIPLCWSQPAHGFNM